jgi:uncharacterized protein YjbI with pentapeptide repeats
MNNEHVNILKSGVEEFNAWRCENPQICPNLSGAVLSYADLRYANLSGAVLSYAVLRGADLHDADLRYADLSNADLSYAVLRGADLHDADLSYANLSGAVLRGAENIPALAAAQLAILSDGEIFGYKKLANGSVAKLRIPADAQRSNATGRKCRCDFADVLEGEGHSQHDPDFYYRVGERVQCHEWDPDRWSECGGGIHFFLTREEAEAY